MGGPCDTGGIGDRRSDASSRPGLLPGAVQRPTPRMTPDPRSDHDGPPAIIVGGIGSTISVTRSLGRAGVRVLVLCAGQFSLAKASRYCAGVIDVGPAPNPGERWLEWLEASGPRGAVLLPSGDEGLELIVRRRDRLEDLGYRLPETAGDVSLAMLDKARTYELARECEVPAPQTWTVNSPMDVDAIAETLTYPCALKPLHSHLFSKHFPFKVFIARSEADLRRDVAETSARGLEMLITEIVPGPDENTWSYTTYLDGDAEPAFEITRNKLRAE